MLIRYGQQQKRAFDKRPHRVRSTLCGVVIFDAVVAERYYWRWVPARTNWTIVGYDGYGGVEVLPPCHPHYEMLAWW